MTASSAGGGVRCRTYQKLRPKNGLRGEEECAKTGCRDDDVVGDAGRGKKRASTIEGLKTELSAIKKVTQKKKKRLRVLTPPVDRRRRQKGRGGSKKNIMPIKQGRGTTRRCAQPAVGKKEGFVSPSQKTWKRGRLTTGLLEKDRWRFWQGNGQWKSEKNQNGGRRERESLARGD